MFDGNKQLNIWHIRLSNYIKDLCCLNLYKRLLAFFYLN